MGKTPIYKEAWQSLSGFGASTHLRRRRKLALGLRVFPLPERSAPAPCLP